MKALRLEDRSDEHLCRMAGGGDKAAFAVLVRRHQDSVFGLALRLTGDYELAGDAAQEALIRAWKALPGFRGDAALSTWLYRITVNTVWTHRHRARRRRAERIEDVVHLLPPSESHNPVRSAESAEVGGRIRLALEALPTGRRTVVVLKDVYGWSHAEIAETLGISVPATKVRLHRARLQLQGMLEDL